VVRILHFINYLPIQSVTRKSSNFIFLLKLNSSDPSSHLQLLRLILSLRKWLEASLT